MVKTHLPAHMDSVRQKCRPKHQLLILKCYPRLPKNSAADVKPNGSELSYLLYYASTRRSKLQKVGSFLERKTASDVYRWQSARVLVTLQILTALLENKAVGAGSGFVLIAPYVLRIIREILQNTNDISLIEASLETWEVFCKHQDQATLKADHEYRELYEDVVKRYATFAQKDKGKKLGKSTKHVAIQDAIRLREIGLNALKSVLLSDALATDSGPQLDIVVPAILSNIHGEDDAYLTHLLGLSKKSEDDEKDKAMARRMSTAPIRTHTGFTEESAETDPREAEGTVQDADDFAEEEAAVLALECLRTVFSDENRPQIRLATSVLLRYVADVECRPATQRSEKSVPDLMVDTWGTKLFETCTTWTPVQDRFILMVTAAESLVRLPLKECDLSQHLLYTQLIDHILRSDLNLIGLSVMDILLSLIQQILRVLQLNGPRATGRGSTGQLFSSQEDIKHPSSSGSEKPNTELPPSEARIRLTERLKCCIADLGSHVYYTDQIADMISAILLRLKPNSATTGQQNPAATAAAIEEPKSAVTEVASYISASARDRSSSGTNGFFSFETARQIALESVRDVLRVSHSSRSNRSSPTTELTNKIPVTIWEGTQWLLRDPAPNVRQAYVDALTTWLKLETGKADMRIKEPKDKAKRKQDGVLARRAVSNASGKKQKQSKKATNSFLQLLHLAVFENALNFASAPAGDEVVNEKEILTLHFLLATLVQRLGVNAVVSGLPMIFALQEEIGKTELASAKTRLGSLVHGYLWALVEVFDFDVAPVGREIFTEIRTRKEHGAWMDDITVMPKTLEQIKSISRTLKITSGMDVTAIQPFDQRQDLIDRISESYSVSVSSPPASAPGSPGRSSGARRLSVTAQAIAVTSYLSVKQTTSATLPQNVKEAMMEKWTKDGCLAAIAAVAPKSVSLSGSRSSPNHALASGNHRQLLAVAHTGEARNSSPMPAGQRLAQNKQQNSGARLDSSQSPNRRASASTNGQASSSAGVHGRLRVDDLKRVLAGGGFTTGLVGRFADTRDKEDAASDSMVEVEGQDLESESGGFVTPPSRMDSTGEGTGTLLAVPEAIPEEGKNSATEHSPVLELPSDTVTNGQMSTSPQADHGTATVADGSVRSMLTISAQKPPSRGGASVKSKGGHSRKDLTALLAGIKVDGGTPNEEKKFAGMGRPPY